MRYGLKEEVLPWVSMIGQKTVNEFLFLFDFFFFFFTSSIVT